MKFESSKAATRNFRRSQSEHLGKDSESLFHDWKMNAAVTYSMVQKTRFHLLDIGYMAVSFLFLGCGWIKYNSIISWLLEKKMLAWTWRHNTSSPAVWNSIFRYHFPVFITFLLIYFDAASQYSYRTLLSWVYGIQAQFCATRSHKVVVNPNICVCVILLLHTHYLYHHPNNIRQFPWPVFLYICA
jgi:hypothetical protein